MSNRIQIKRSSVTAIPASLNPGELAYSNTSQVLYIGDTSGTVVVPIAGYRNPGILTANQAIVTNASSAVDHVIVGNVSFTGVNQTININGSVGTSGYVLVSNGSSNAYWTDPYNFPANTSQQYTWTNTQTFSNTVTFSTIITVNNEIYVGNSTVNVSINSTSFSGTANNSLNFDGLSPSTWQTYITSNSTTAYTNAVGAIYSNNGIFTGNNTFSGLYTNISGTANVATLAVTGSATIAGNLTVSGTVTSLNTTIVQISNNMIELADNQANGGVFSDLVDIGFYGVIGNTTSTYYSGFYRDHAASSNSNPVFKIFESNTQPGGTVSSTGYSLGTLEAYLQPYGAGGALVANSSAVSISSNSALSVTINANTLTLSTPLAATSGGTGLNTYTSGDILVANTGNTLSRLGIGTDGYVLQVSGSTVAWSYIDGGVF